MLFLGLFGIAMAFFEYIKNDDTINDSQKNTLKTLLLITIISLYVSVLSFYYGYNSLAQISGAVCFIAIFIEFILMMYYSEIEYARKKYYKL
ncbi:MAG: hypothetical protein QXZ12_01375 [Thermoplasmata archaeon]